MDAAVRSCKQGINRYSWVLEEESLTTLIGLEFFMQFFS